MALSPIYIPLDLQINIFLRLPVKSLLRFRCVSKLWSSIITSHDFRNRHLNITASSAPPRLLFAFHNLNAGELLLVSSPNPNTSSSLSSSCCVPYRDLSLLKILHTENPKEEVYNAVRGMICVGSGLKVEICNPSTRELHIFPKIKFKAYPGVLPRPSCFFGYDPVEDQYKVLAVDYIPWRSEHKVIVLGGEEAWREAPCLACPHVVCTRRLYMNGTMYYGAYRKNNDPPNSNYIFVYWDITSRDVRD